MNTPQRRNLLAGLSTVAPTDDAPVGAPEAVLEAAAERHGFAPPAPARTAVIAPVTQRRERKSVGRSHQLSVKIKPEAANLIYAEANRLNVPIAQVIEDAIAVLLNARQ
jgi:hypothetical protein